MELSETRDFDTIGIQKESKDTFSFLVAKFKKGLKKKETLFVTIQW